MTTLEMRAAMQARADAPAWPEPEQRAVVVEPTDKRVPSGARGIVKLADAEGWTAELTYSRGTSMVGKECAPGPVVASVLLRAQRAGERVAALWLASPKASCAGCGKPKTPLPSGLIRRHKAPPGLCSNAGTQIVTYLNGAYHCSECGRRFPGLREGKALPPHDHLATTAPTTADRDGQKNDCAGSGQPAKLNPIGVSDYAFSVAYATEGPGWWTAHVPTRVDITQLRECLRGNVASVVAVQAASTRTQTPES